MPHKIGLFLRNELHFPHRLEESFSLDIFAHNSCSPLNLKKNDNNNKRFPHLNFRLLLSDLCLVQPDPALYSYINQGVLTVDSIDDSVEMKLTDVSNGKPRLFSVIYVEHVRGKSHVEIRNSLHTPRHNQRAHPRSLTMILCVRE